MKTTTCRGCGRKIVFGRTEEGKLIPLDPAAPVYFIEDPTTNPPVIQRAAKELYMVSHFKTCSEANRFGKGKK